MMYWKFSSNSSYGVFKSMMSSRQFANHHIDTQSNNTELKLVVKGFSRAEWQLLHAVIKLSERRQPRISFINDLYEDRADIVMIDGTDANAMSWAATTAWLRHKVVIWVDAPSTSNGYAVKRPLQWSSLPMLLVRALEHTPAKATVPSTNSVANAVLVVDDSLAVRGQLRSLLEQRGMAVTEADCAEAAIKLTASTSYACILMDVLMPGLNGYEACRQIKANTGSTKKKNIVMLTSRASPFDRIKGKMSGCDAYLTKPVNPEQLYEVLSRFVTQPANNDLLPQQMSALQFAK